MREVWTPETLADMMFIKTYGSYRSEKNLLLNKSLITPWTYSTRREHSEGQRIGWPFACVFSQIRWYFLACLHVVISRRRHCIAALRRNGDSMPVRVYLPKQIANELLAGKIRV